MKITASVIITLVILLITIPGCTSQAASSTAQTGAASSAHSEANSTGQEKSTQKPIQKGLLEQDMTLLKENNGKIIDLQPVSSGSIETYKIRYLSDGLEVVGYLVKPKESADKCPVLIYNRGGNREFGKIESGGFDLALMSTLAMQGFVVLASQYRGNDGGQGREEFGGSDINDVLNLIPLAESLPFISPHNMAMMGTSRGGMMTYIALTKSTKIKAAAIYSGITDCIQTYNEREQAMKQVLIDLIGGTPTQKEQEYIARSANYWPERINTPVLILHGDADQSVNVSQAQNLAGKLKALNKPCELVIYPNGDHALSGLATDTNTKILSWFTRYLPDFKVKTPWLGIQGKTIDRTLANTLKLPVDSGVYVIMVIQGSPAEKAGLVQSGLNNQKRYLPGGDIITQIDTTLITKMEDLQGYLMSKNPGDTVTLTIYRGTEKLTLPVQLGILPVSSN